MLRPIPLHHRRLGSGVLCVHARTLRIWERADLELISGKCEACMGFSIHRTDCTEAHTPRRSERTPNCESTQSVHSFAGIVKSCPLHPHDCRRHCAHLQLTAWYNKSSGGHRNPVSRARERKRKRERERERDSSTTQPFPLLFSDCWTRSSAAASSRDLSAHSSTTTYVSTAASTASNSRPKCAVLLSVPSPLYS